MLLYTESVCIISMIFSFIFIGIYLVPVSSWTMDRAGSKRASITGINDRKQITAVFCANAIGEFFPIQLIYAGKTNRCHPKFSFPRDWSITNTENNWSIEMTMKVYLKDIIILFVKKTRINLGVAPTQPTLAIFDHFKGQRTKSITDTSERNNIHSVLVPASCTDKLQPMDVSVNRAAKAFLEHQFQDWCANQVLMNMRAEEELMPVNFSSAKMKHLGAMWLVQMLFDHLTNNPHLIVNEFINTGISGSISDAITTRHEEHDYSSSDDDVSNGSIIEATFSD